MQNLGIDRAHTVGHDMGALAAFEFTGTYPDATVSMTYVDEQSVGAPVGIAGSVGWSRSTFETARQMQAIGAAGFAVAVMAWGGAYGVPVTHAQFEAIPGEESGGIIIPCAGHFLPEEVPDVLAKLEAFFVAAEAQ